VQTDIGKMFKEFALKNITERFKDFEHNTLLSEATILDPRFKKVHFKDKLAVYPAIKK
jgi:hypothetical protein